MLSQKVIRVSEEFGDEPIELPLENDGTLLLSTLNSAFPNATGIKFRNPVNNCLRAVKLENNKFHSPGIGIDDDGWESSKIQYFCVFPKVTVADESTPVTTSTSSYLSEQKASSNNSIPTMTASASGSSGSGAQPKTVDLIVLNLSSNTTEDGLRDYFESKFGPLLMVELKRDRKTGSSRRFAFIRFHNYMEQMKALQQLRHKIDNQQIRLALPDFRDPSELYQENKCFVGRVNEQIKAGDLRDFFSQFGDIVEISYPKKFKGYAFITFADPEIARKVCGQDFIVKGYSLCVSKSTHGGSKNKEPYQQPYAQQNYPQNNYQQDFTQDWNGSNWYQGQQQQHRDWMPGQKYITQPLNSNYGNGNMNNPMVSALSLAMQHANQIMATHGGYNHYNRNNNNGTALWHPNQQQQQQHNNNPNKNNATKKNKQKKKNNAAKKAKDDLSKRLEKQGGDDNGEEEGGDDSADVVVEEVSKIDLSDESENKDLKQEA